MSLEVTNILAVLVTALIPMAIGMFWYSKLAFGMRWMRYEGVTPEEEMAMKKKPLLKNLVISYITYLFISYALSILLNYLVIAAIIPAVILGIVVWLGFVVPALISDYLWSPRGKAWGLYYLNIGYFLVSVVLMSAVLALWI